LGFILQDGFGGNEAVVEVKIMLASDKENDEKRNLGLH